MKIWENCFAMVILLFGVHASAQTLGPTYPIIERDMLEEIESNLKEKQRSGELARLQIEAKNRSIASIESPPSAVSLPVARKARVTHFDPSFTVSQTVKDHEGRVIAEAGTIVNPLDYVQMPTTLLFIDGSDERQIVFADGIVAHYQGNVKLILTNGSPIALGKKKGYQVFFDQGGALSKKLKLRALPSLVSQDGKVLRIDELEVK